MTHVRVPTTVDEIDQTRALMRAFVAWHRTAGYSVMRLDTSFRQAEAQALYRRLGFSDIEPYYELPEELRNWLVFMELPLQLQIRS